MDRKIKEIIIPLAIFILFLTIETFMNPGEVVLLFMSLFFILTIFYIKRNKGEIKLFLLGFTLGLFIEVTLAGFSRHQMWESAQYLNIPLWLPIAWGMGFVIVTRLGMEAREIRKNV